MADERDHDLRARVATGPLDGDLRVQDRPRLDLYEVRDQQPQPAATEPEHRVLLVESVRGREQLARLRVLGLALGSPGRVEPRDLFDQLLAVRQELVEWRIDQPDHDGQAVHCPEDALEVALLETFELRQGGGPVTVTATAPDGRTSTQSSLIVPGQTTRVPRMEIP